MKKSNIVLTSMLIAFSSMSFAGMKVVDSQNGAWVTVTDNGKPVADAVVKATNVAQSQAEYKTNEKGRVFIPLTMNASKAVKYKAVTPEGKEFGRFAFHGKS
ncbi:hypothetical protein A3K86_02775 [Photobacterium jeanii]|uniref:Uncharacterized protein n=1 Tax=Photobacterium jeanii TaxID=858640 RepID=A0A178KKF3_9GAMM|nr:hypothetical protein [Photobacterium jeanii]OAN17858.1 hypothetical protein A3K86_02775 [Photobacterium jeanii]PST92474.1 hypothetical protein C9I91_04695 [Photobacterium jeanii]